MPKRKPPKRVADKITLQTREEIAKMTLMNNNFMNLALEDNISCVEEMLRVILEKQDLVVRTARTQKFFQGFKRSVYLDIFAEDSNGVLYNIEIQQADEGADPRRARFHTGMIDVHNLKAGQDFKKLPECYVIFITLNDVLDKYIDGSMKSFDDGSHLIYINGSAKDNGTEVGKLVHDLRCTKADEMFFPRLAARIKFLKEDERGVKIVSDYFAKREAKAVKEAVEEAVRKAVIATEKKDAKAQKKEKESMVLNLINLGKLSLEEIAECSGLTLKKIRMLATTL